MLKYHTIDDFISQFSLRKSGREWVGACPRPACTADDDGFHVKEGANGPVFGCRGCIDGGQDSNGLNFAEVISLLGKQEAPLAQRRVAHNGGPCSPFCGVYDRVDGKGVVANHRYDKPKGGNPPKTFQQVPGGSYKCHVAIHKGDMPGPVILVEGEKAASAVTAAGFAAASWIGGANRVGMADFSRLAGREVVIWPDNDEPGQKAMRAASVKLEGVATSLRWVDVSDAADGADAYDCLDVPERIFSAVERDVEPTIVSAIPELFSEADMTAHGHCVRLLRKYVDRLMVVKTSRGAARLLVLDARSGVWRDSADRLSDWVTQCAKDWVSLAADRAISSPDMRAVYRAFRRGLTDSGVAEVVSSNMVNSAQGALVRAGADCPQECREVELDAQRQYLGVKNGVVDLATGRLLPPDEARGKLVTRQAPYDYRPDVEHPDADALLAHLSTEERGYLQSAFGFALWGNPARRIYGLEGQPNGGKSTLLTAIINALGSVSNGGYAMRVEGEHLVASKYGNPNGHNEGLIGIQDARIAVCSEMSETGRLNMGLLKKLDGQESLRIRGIHEKSGAERPASATLILAYNPPQAWRLDTSEAALQDRVRILPYPPLPAPESGFRDRLGKRPVLEALLSMMIGWAVANPPEQGPPQDTPKVAEARRRQRVDSIGRVGQWIEMAIEKTKSQDHRLYTGEIWDRLGKAFGLDKPELIDGLNQRRLTGRVRDLLGLGAARQFGTNKSGWAGYRLRTDAEINAALAPDVQPAPEPVPLVEDGAPATFKGQPLPDVQQCRVCGGDYIPVNGRECGQFGPEGGRIPCPGWKAPLIPGETKPPICGIFGHYNVWFREGAAPLSDCVAIVFCAVCEESRIAAELSAGRIVPMPTDGKLV